MTSLFSSTLAIIFPGVASSPEHNYAHTDEESYGGEDNAPIEQLQLPHPVYERDIIHIANDSLSEKRKDIILADMDSICRNQGCISMRIDDMDREIFLRHVTLSNGIHPLLKRAVDEFNLEFMISYEQGASPITKTLRELMPSAEEKTVWIQDIDISSLYCDYSHSLEVKTEEPDSEWSPWWEDEYSPKSEEQTTIIPFTTRSHNMINRIVNCNPEKIRIPRNRTWALYVAGMDLDSLRTQVSEDTILLKRNLSTVLMMETLRTSQLPHDMRLLLDACALQNDSKSFKMSVKFYEFLKKVTHDTLKITKLLDTKLSFRRFDQKPWVEQKDTVITVNIRMQLSIFYRFYSASEESEDDS